MLAFASGTWDSPDLFDLALFKHSDHPVKLRLMDRACHSERPRQQENNLVTHTHLSFVVERDIVCTGALVLRCSYRDSVRYSVARAAI